MNNMSDENAVCDEIEKRRTRYLDMVNINFLSALENEQKNNLLKENLNIRKAAGFSNVSIFGILRLINVKKKQVIPDLLEKC